MLVQGLVQVFFPGRPAWTAKGPRGPRPSFEALRGVRPQGCSTACCARSLDVGPPPGSNRPVADRAPGRPYRHPELIRAVQAVREPRPCGFRSVGLLACLSVAAARGPASKETIARRPSPRIRGPQPRRKNRALRPGGTRPGGPCAYGRLFRFPGPPQKGALVATSGRDAGFRASASGGCCLQLVGASLRRRWPSVLVLGPAPPLPAIPPPNLSFCGRLLWVFWVPGQQAAPPPARPACFPASPLVGRAWSCAPASLPLPGHPLNGPSFSSLISTEIPPPVGRASFSGIVQQHRWTGGWTKLLRRAAQRLRGQPDPRLFRGGRFSDPRAHGCAKPRRRDGDLAPTVFRERNENLSLLFPPPCLVAVSQTQFSNPQSWIRDAPCRMFLAP